VDAPEIICFRTVGAINERLQAPLDRGQTGVSYGGDNPMFRGFDIDDVDRELVEWTGAMIDSLADHRIAMDGMHIGEVSCALVDVSPHELVAMHVALADERGVPRNELAGSTMHPDYLDKMVGARMFTRFPQAAHRRLFRDCIEYVLEHLPKWNLISLTEQNIQQAGATPAQEAAFIIAASVDYLEEVVDLGFDPDDCAERFSFFFFIVSTNLFEEVAKHRAARRIWTRVLARRFDVAPENFRLRCHCQIDGQELTRTRPTSNVSRVALQARPRARPKMLDQLAEYGFVEETLILASGNVPREDHERLREAGVDGCSPRTRGRTRSSSTSGTRCRPPNGWPVATGSRWGQVTRSGPRRPRRRGG